MLQDKMKNKVVFSVFWLILFIFSFCFSQIPQDPRIGLLPYHERLKALQRYEEIRQFQDNLTVFQEKVKKYDLSKDLMQNNPRQYEQNWRFLADLYGEFAQTIKLPSSFTPQMRDAYYQDFAEKRKSFIKNADDFRRNVKEAIEREKSKIVENFVKNTIITAVAIAASVVTAGASSPLLVSAVASWGTDLALSGYQYYNWGNREIYDAINWSRSEEFKAAQVTASAAKVAIGFATHQLGYKDTLQGAQTTLQIASIGQPYYNQDTNKTLVTAQLSLSVYSSSVDLARDRNATSVVAPSKQVATEINPQYAANYTAAQRWELVSNISRDISATTQIISSLSTLYTVYNPQNTSASKLSSDLNFCSNIISYVSQIPGGIATRLATQVNEDIIMKDYGSKVIPNYKIYNQEGTSGNLSSENSKASVRREVKIEELYKEMLVKIKDPNLAAKYNQTYISLRHDLSYNFLRMINDLNVYEREQSAYWRMCLNQILGINAIFNPSFNRLSILNPGVGGNYYDKKVWSGNNFAK
jgi:hypothetical protein